VPKLALETPALVGRLANGEAIVALAAAPSLASFGEEEEGPLAARLYLSEVLAHAAPSEVVRYGLPEGTRLHTTDVVVPREDLPRRWAVTTPIGVTSLVLPTPPNAKGLRDAWVVLLRPYHTFFVASGDDLDEAVRHELLRLCAAQELTPAQYLGLLPLRAETLVPLRIDFERGVAASASRAADGKRRVAEAEARKAAIAVLDSIAEPLHTALGHGERPFPLRDAERELLGRLLGGDERASVLLVGPERVGKTGLFRAWLEREHASGRARYVYGTSGARLVAGMSGFGQWQERVRRVMEAASTLDALLYFDDFADLFADRPGGSVDIPSALRPWIEDGRVRVVGEIRDDVLERVEARHAALFSCFGRVRLEPFGATQATLVLTELSRHDAERTPPRPALSAAAIATVVELAGRYVPYESFPGKAVRLAEELRAATEARLGSRASEPGATIAPADVYTWFSARTGVPTFLLRDDEELRFADTVASLRRRLVGQDEAVRRVAELVGVVKAGLAPAGKPLATLLFVGPTGVGKTELARALAELLFGDEGRLLRFDMSEYADSLAADRLFRGNDGGEGLLTRKVREQPFSVVLLDEIEKAHAGVFDLLLQVCGEGRLTDGRGKTAYFHSAFIILTSNLGAAQRRPVAGFGARSSDAEDHYLRVVRETFRPELVNRIDRVVAFRALDEEEIRAVTSLTTARATRRRGLTERGIELAVSEAAADHLARAGMSEAYGARALRRHVERALLTPVARLVSAWGAGVEGERVVVDVESAPPAPREEPGVTDGGLRFGVVRVPARRSSRAAHELQRIMELRRQMSSELRLERVEQLDDQVDYLVAQLSRPEAGARAEDLATMQGEHHRLASLREELSSAFEDVCSLEELALSAYLSGEEAGSLWAEVEPARTRFCAALVRALVAQEKRRHGATLLVLELDANRAMDLWLAPLLRDLTRRGWTAAVHVDGDEKDDGWPAHRRWGPPRTPEWALDRLQLSERPFRGVLLRVDGDHAGVWLALEAGLHRYSHFGHSGSGAPADLHVALLAQRTALTDGEWSPPLLDPPAPTAASELSKRAPVRDHDGRAERLVVCKQTTVHLPPSEYWLRFEEVALAHLVLFERGLLDGDRESALRPRLDDSFAEVLRYLREGQKISAIKAYRALTGSSLAAARDAVEAME